jgi:hypothetical protein
MVHGDELAIELADADPVAVGDDALRDIPQLVFPELLGQQRQRQFGSDERDVGSLSQQVGHSADVVFVTVCEHQAADIGKTFADGIESGQDQVDTGVIIFGKQHTAVDEQQLTVELDRRHIAADIA